MSGTWQPASARGWIDPPAGPQPSRPFFLHRQRVVEAEATVETVLAGRVRNSRMARLEAALLVADGALSARRLAQLATLAESSEVRRLVDQLNAAYDLDDSAFRVERVATGFQLLTRPEFAFWLDRVYNRQTELKLSVPAMETLAIVAYRQPITRSEIEKVRGVQCTETLKHLLDRGVIRIGGEEETLGRPYLYETTRRFLEHFGLNGLKELPYVERIRGDQPNDENSGDDSDREPDADDDDADGEDPADDDVADDVDARDDDESEDDESEDDESEDDDEDDELHE